MNNIAGVITSAYDFVVSPFRRTASDPLLDDEDPLLVTSPQPRKDRPYKQAEPRKRADTTEHLKTTRPSRKIVVGQRKRHNPSTHVSNAVAARQGKRQRLDVPELVGSRKSSRGNAGKFHRRSAKISHLSTTVKKRKNRRQRCEEQKQIEALPQNEQLEAYRLLIQKKTTVVMTPCHKGSYLEDFMKNEVNYDLQRSRKSWSTQPLFSKMAQRLNQKNRRARKGIDEVTTDIVASTSGDVSIPSRQQFFASSSPIFQPRVDTTTPMDSYVESPIATSDATTPVASKIPTALPSSQPFVSSTPILPPRTNAVSLSVVPAVESPIVVSDATPLAVSTIPKAMSSPLQESTSSTFTSHALQRLKEIQNSASKGDESLADSTKSRDAILSTSIDERADHRSGIVDAIENAEQSGMVVEGRPAELPATPIVPSNTKEEPAEFGSPAWVKYKRDMFAERQRLVEEKLNELKPQDERLQQEREIILKQKHEKQSAERAEHDAREVPSTTAIAEEIDKLSFPKVDGDFKPLSSEQISLVDNMWDNELDQNTVLYRHKNDTIELARHDLGTLEGTGWLNDAVMNGYFYLLQQRNANDSSLPTSWHHSTFFYSKLKEKGYASVRRWTKPSKCPGGLFSKDLVVIPVHLGVHWCCGFIDFRSKQIELYDSMGMSEKIFFRHIREYLNAESQDKLSKPFDFDGWTDVTDNNCPQQNNSFDCGVFALKFSDFRTRDMPFKFNQGDIQYFRQRACWELTQGEWGKGL